MPSPLAVLVALLVPPACCACRAPLAVAGEALCPACRRGLPWLRGERCPRCGLAAHRSGGRRCPAGRAAFSAAWAPVAYAGPARALVAAVKYHGATAAVDGMAAAIAAGAPPGLLEGGELVPVATHAARRRARGFDQAALLARALRRRTGLPVAAVLRRAGPAAAQAGATRRERVAAGRVAFGVRGRVPGRAVLVDDVHTTGATLDAAARALRAAGAEEVVAVAYARTL